MTRILRPFASLALMLALAIPLTVAAHGATDDPPEVAYTTGTVTGQPVRIVDPQNESPAEGLRQLRGWTVVGIPIEMDDPRLSGRLSFVSNGAGQDFADGQADIESRAYRLDNDEGAWAGAGTSVSALRGSTPLMDQTSAVLIGEGAYEGLTAYFAVETVDGAVVIEAVVLENEVAPPPDPVPATALADGPAFAGVDQIEAFLASMVGDGGGGMTGLVVQDGVTITSAAGIADASGLPMQPDDVFRVGSVAKMFVAAMILQLVDEGLVDLDAPLATYLPETSVGGDVTVRQLLSHRSGIPSVSDQQPFLSDLFEDPERVFTADDTLGYIADVPGGEPDQQYYYSNTNYILLGQLLEAVDDTDLESALQARIAEPLGLTSTRFDIDGASASEELVGGWAEGMFAGDRAAEYASVTSAAWSAGGLVSAPADLARFMSALMGGELVSDESLTQMLETGPEGYGLGIATMPPGAPAGGFYGHNGGIPGFNSFVAMDPETGDIVILLSNQGMTNATVAGAQVLEAWASTDG